jgi:predicted dehydrogenase
MTNTPTATLALVGLGMVAPTYAEAIRTSPGLRLKWVLARSAESAQGFLRDHPDLGAQVASDLSHIAQDPEVDFALLTTPPNARHEIVTALADAGKPILMEKPVERDLPAATALVAHCEAAGVPLSIMLQHRARPLVADLHQRVAALGPLMAAEIAVPWWRPQAYYDAPGRGSYARDGGGVLISQAIHTLDLALQFTGPVAEVTAMTGTTGFHRMEAEDFVSAGLRFENGALGHLHASTASFPGRGETITLHYRDGSAHLAAGNLRIDHADGHSETLGQAASSGAGADPMAFTCDWHRAVIEDFADSLRAGRAPMIPGRSALEVHRLITALERSGRDGQRMALSDL